MKRECVCVCVARPSKVSEQELRASVDSSSFTTLVKSLISLVRASPYSAS